MTAQAKEMPSSGRQVSRLPGYGHDAAYGGPSSAHQALSILLLATCKQTQLALEAAANLLDTGLSRDLETMIERTKSELKEMNATIQALSGK
jgi:hypothetical protein